MILEPDGKSFKANFLELAKGENQGVIKIDHIDRRNGAVTLSVNEVQRKLNFKDDAYAPTISQTRRPSGLPKSPLTPKKREKGKKEKKEKQKQTQCHHAFHERFFFPHAGRNATWEPRLHFASKTCSSFRLYSVFTMVEAANLTETRTNSVEFVQKKAAKNAGSPYE